MAAFAFRDPSRPGYEGCTGCRLCVLPCPVWQQTRDVTLTLMGRARAIQGGAGDRETAESLAACVVCGACEPVCPEGLDTVGETLRQRAALSAAGAPVIARAAPRPFLPEAPVAPFARGRDVLLAGPDLSAEAALLDRVVAALGGPSAVAVAADDGRDLAFALEAGDPIEDARADRFLASLVGARSVVCAEGILVRPLASRLSRTAVRGVGEALLREAATRAALGRGDLLVLETRAYHADRERLVRFYDALAAERGVTLALDLHRIALPTGATSLQSLIGAADPAVTLDEQARWILEGRSPSRIVCESSADARALAARTAIPVVHLATLATAAAVATRENAA